jgi:glucose-1-phosphate adenylyltransferase
MPSPISISLIPDGQCFPGPVARVVGSQIDNSLLGAATLIQDAHVRNSIVRREAVIEEGAEIEGCVIMDYVRVRGCSRLRHAIVDRHNLIEKDSRIGFDIEEDRRRYSVSPDGVVVVPRGRTPYFARGGRGCGIDYAE